MYTITYLMYAIHSRDRSLMCLIEKKYKANHSLVQSFRFVYKIMDNVRHTSADPEGGGGGGRRSGPPLDIHKLYGFL